MIHYKKHVLSNGLRVLISNQPKSSQVVVNVLYDVGSKDEQSNKTGFAHFFEHLMFSGTKREPDFDVPLHKIGASNNAFTSTDLTNYYIQTPPENLEMALYMEADRMESLGFSEEAFRVQQSVVIEEFKQRYLNQPYGDVWLYLRELTWKKGGYSWATIGKKLEHIEAFTLDEVKQFYKKFYNPNNAILVVAGNLDEDETLKKIEKYFTGIKNAAEKPQRNWEGGEKLTSNSESVLERVVPTPAFYRAWQMPGHLENEYYTLDLLSDILSGGKSSRLNQEILACTNLFSSLDAYITGEIYEGLFVIGGRLQTGADLKNAMESVNAVLHNLQSKGILAEELSRMKNKFITSFHMMNVSTWNKAFLLAYFELLGNASLVNELPEKYSRISTKNLLNSFDKWLYEKPFAQITYQPKES